MIHTERSWCPALPRSPDWPNLFIIGAAKSGTTSLHHYLDGHPQVLMCDPKEPQYFVDTPWMPKDPEWYLGLFKSDGDVAFRGESSPFYTMLPTHQGVPERIAQVSKEPRFIYVMRDPVGRLISHYWFDVSYIREGRSFWKFIEQEPRYVDWGDYLMQLRPWVDTFGRENVYTLTFETLTEDPVLAVRGITEWLGLPPINEGDFASKWNVTPEAMRQPRFQGVVESFRRSALWERLAPLVPGGLRRAASRATERDVARSELEVEEVAAAMRSRYLPMVEALQEYLGREFPEWTTVGAAP